MSLRIGHNTHKANVNDQSRGHRGAVVWREGNIVAYEPPEPCHCGGVAIYREGKLGFCKNHRDDAVKAAKKKSARRFA